MTEAPSTTTVRAGGGQQKGAIEIGSEDESSGDDEAEATPRSVCVVWDGVALTSRPELPENIVPDNAAVDWYTNIPPP